MELLWFFTEDAISFFGETIEILYASILALSFFFFFSFFNTTAEMTLNKLSFLIRHANKFFWKYDNIMLSQWFFAECNVIDRAQLVISLEITGYQSAVSSPPTIRLLIASILSPYISSRRYSEATGSFDPSPRTLVALIFKANPCVPVTPPKASKTDLLDKSKTSLKIEEHDSYHTLHNDKNYKQKTLKN